MKNEVIEAIIMGANEINRLRNENKELQERIVKTIEYIENNLEEGFTIPKLLEILKGEDK